MFTLFHPTLYSHHYFHLCTKAHWNLQIVKEVYVDSNISVTNKTNWWSDKVISDIIKTIISTVYVVKNFGRLSIFCRRAEN